MARRSHRKARRNPPEGGYMNNIGYLLAASAAAFGVAATANYVLERYTYAQEGGIDFALGLGSLLLGGAVGLLGTPGKIRMAVGGGIAAGGVALAGVRFMPYAMLTEAEKDAHNRGLQAVRDFYNTGSLPAARA